MVVDAFGETPLEAIAEHLRIEDQPAPTDLGPGEVLVAVRSAAVGWVDLLMTSGQYQHMATPPYTPGLEFAGEIAAVGSEVADLAVGTRVVVDPFVVGPRTSGPSPSRRSASSATKATPLAPPPNTSLPMRARLIAPAHMAQGSSVTYIVRPVRR